MPYLRFPIIRAWHPKSHWLHAVAFSSVARTFLQTELLCLAEAEEVLFKHLLTPYFLTVIQKNNTGGDIFPEVYIVNYQ
jgi:hypothetical protein